MWPVQVKILKGLKAESAAEAEAYEALRQELRKEHPDHLPVYMEGLKRAAAKIKAPFGVDAAPATVSKEAAEAEGGAEEGTPTAGDNTREACKAVVAAADEVRPRLSRRRMAVSRCLSGSGCRFLQPLRLEAAARTSTLAAGWPQNRTPTPWRGGSGPHSPAVCYATQAQCMVCMRADLLRWPCCDVCAGRDPLMGCLGCRPCA